MRLLYTFADQNQGMKFSHFLKGQGVENQLEPLTNRDWGSDDYGTTFNRIWIIEEDQYETALNWLNQFEANPSDARFNTPEASLTKIIEPFKDSITEKPEEMIPNVEVIDDRPMKKNRSPLTYYLLLICGLLFLLTSITAPKPLEIPSSLPSTALFASPVYKALIYDYPEAYDIIDQLIATYGIEKLQSPSSLPKEGQLLLQKFYQTPYWKGLYPQLVNKLEGKAVSWDAPLFEKIRQGEIWRLLSPALLHADIFHIFFNLIWLLILGKQIEERIGSKRYLLFILLTGIFSNTCQYLMGGANFVGFSGVLTAMIGFVWVRQNQATWEGYQVNTATFAFISFFILTMFIVQLISFFFEVYLQTPIAPGIANTAHLTGALAGYILGKTHFFARRIG